MTAVAFGASRSSHSLLVTGWPVIGLFPKPDQYPSDLIFSLGIEPSMTRTNGSSSPRSALHHHSMKLSAPVSGPHSKSINGQCTWIFGRPGSAPSTISSMLGWVAAVSATESPSHDRPALIHRMCSTGSAAVFSEGSAAVFAAAIGHRLSRRLPQRGRSPDTSVYAGQICHKLGNGAVCHV